jgi:hypothetical protein
MPKYIAWTNDRTCYARVPSKRAACIESAGSDSFATTCTTRTRTAGQYNPIYYALIGWPLLIFPNSKGVFVMRFVSGILSSLFLALSLLMISTWPRPVLTLAGLMDATTPMVLSIDDIVNPNSLEIAGTLATFVGILGVVIFPDSVRRAPTIVVTITAASLAVDTRPLSAVWIAVAILTPLLFTSRGTIYERVKTRDVRLAIAGVGAATVFALGWIAIVPILTLHAADAGITPPAIYHSAARLPSPDSRL